MQEAIIKQGVKSKMKSAKNMFKVDTQAGNACIYTCFVMLNFCLFLSSLGILGADIFLFVKIGTNIFSWIFLGLGAGLFGCSLASFKLRKSVHLLFMYLLIIFGIFFCMIIATIVLLIQKEGVVDKIWQAAGLPADQ